WLLAGRGAWRFVPPGNAMGRAPDEHGPLEGNPLLRGPDAGLDPETRFRSGDVDGDLSRRREKDDRRGLAPRLHQGKPQDAGLAQQIPEPSTTDRLESDHVVGVAVQIRAVSQPAEGEQLLDQKEPLGGQSGPRRPVTVVVEIGPRDPRPYPIPVLAGYHRPNPNPCRARLQDQFELEP